MGYEKLFSNIITSNSYSSLGREKTLGDRKGGRGFIFCGIDPAQEKGERMVCGEKAREGRTLRGKDIRG